MDSREELETEIAGIPAVIMNDAPRRRDPPRGVVIFHHGLGSHCGANRKELVSLADQGFIAMGIDALGHGRRRWHDYDRLFEPSRFDETFVRVIRETARETPRIVAEIRQRWGQKIGIGMVGISMGGYVTYRAMVDEPSVSCAVSILGSPQWPVDGEESPERFPDRIAPRPLLSLTAERDESVPPAATRAFHEKLRSHYTEHPDALRYVEYPGVGHFMPQEEWDDLWKRTGRWLSRWLVDHP